MYTQTDIEAILRFSWIEQGNDANRGMFRYSAFVAWVAEKPELRRVSRHSDLALYIHRAINA